MVFKISPKKSLDLAQIESDLSWHSFHLHLTMHFHLHLTIIRRDTIKFLQPCMMLVTINYNLSDKCMLTTLFRWLFLDFGDIFLISLVYLGDWFQLLVTDSQFFKWLRNSHFLNFIKTINKKIKKNHIQLLNLSSRYFKTLLHLCSSSV